MRTHQQGVGDNFLNFLMKNYRMITISTPETVEIKKLVNAITYESMQPHTHTQTHLPYLRDH